MQRSRCDRRAKANPMATSITGLTGRSVGTWTNMFLNIAVLPTLIGSRRARAPDDDEETSRSIHGGR